MSVTKMENGMIRYSFEIGTTPYILRDSIVITEDQYNSMTLDDIELVKQQRYDNWYNIITAEPEPVTLDVDLQE